MTKPTRSLREACAAEDYHIIRSAADRYAVAKIVGHGGTAINRDGDPRSPVKIDNLFIIEPVTRALSKHDAIIALSLMRSDLGLPPRWARQGKFMYAIGIEHKPDSFGMTDGPVPDLDAMLSRTSKPGGAIFRFNPDGTHEIIYRWKDDQWQSCEERPKPRKKN